MKIYTKTGDRGETSLWGGARVSKDHLQVEACGSVDELNSLIGVLRSLELPASEDGIFGRIQVELFQLGAELASSSQSKTKADFKPIDSEHIAFLENAIDRYEEQLEPLRQFILPGGSPVGAQCHHVRTVCRRVERRVVSLANSEATHIREEIVVYLNRLSDFLFVLARYLNKVTGETEETWNP